MVDKNKFFAELDAMKPLDVGHKLAAQAFSKKQSALAQEWLRHKFGRDYRTCIYHQIKKPKGEVFMLSDAIPLFRKGWVDTPAKFGKGIRGKWYNFIIFFRTSKETTWQFLIKYRVKILLAVIIGVLSGIILSFILPLLHPKKEESQLHQQVIPQKSEKLYPQQSPPIKK